MPSTTQGKKIDEVMERASEALSRSSYFEAERLAVKALAMAREENDFERISRILLPLQEARRQRLQQALDLGVVSIVTQPITEEMKVKPGCYLVQPPNVGVEARRLRLAALNQDVPVAVVCREPKTQIGLWPIVAIAPGATVRTKIRPPKDSDQPDLTWFVAALEALGDAAIESIDPAQEPDRRVDALLARLDAVRDHELLHQVLADTCREAQSARGPEAAPPAAASPEDGD